MRGSEQKSPANTLVTRRWTSWVSGVTQVHVGQSKPVSGRIPAVQGCAAIGSASGKAGARIEEVPKEVANLGSGVGLELRRLVGDVSVELLLEAVSVESGEWLEKLSLGPRRW